MKTIVVIQGQTLIDIAMQELGDASRLRELALLNNLNITSEITPGQTLLVPDYALDKKDTVKILTNPFNNPASGANPNSEIIIPVGIEFWSIENDFIVQ